MSDSIEDRCINLRDAFEQAMAWVFFPVQFSPEDPTVQHLRDRFNAAVYRDDCYLVIASPRRVVQVFSGKAICTDIPEGHDLDGELKRKFGSGAVSARIDGVFVGFISGFEGEYLDKIREKFQKSFDGARPELRMDMRQ